MPKTASSSRTMTTYCDQQERDCLICLHLLIEPVTFPCNHTVCKTCYDLILEKSNVACPFCRKRLSTWCRSHARFDQLVNHEKWREIREMFPEHVKMAQEGKWDEIESSEAGKRMIDRIISQPGEVKKEFDTFIEREKEWRRWKREEEEEASLEFIKKEFAAEVEFFETRSKQEKEDEELAKSLAEAEKSAVSASKRVFVSDKANDERELRKKRARNYREFFDD